jgi:hypothetical protein
MRLAWVSLVGAGLLGCRFDLPEVQQEDGGLPPGIHTTPIFLSLCPGGPPCPTNTILLDELTQGAGIPGARITFGAQDVSGALYITGLSLVPGPMGALIQHPLFLSLPVDPARRPIVDPLDRYYNVTLNLAPGEGPRLIGGGTAAFAEFPVANQLVIYFRTATIPSP